MKYWRYHFGPWEIEVQKLYGILCVWHTHTYIYIYPRKLDFKFQVLDILLLTQNKKKKKIPSYSSVMHISSAHDEGSFSSLYSSLASYITQTSLNNTFTVNSYFHYIITFHSHNHTHTADFRIPDSGFNL